MANKEDSPKLVALIPARGGSVRVPGKNTRLLAGHPLIAYTISAAIESGVFDTVVVSTDEKRTAEIGRYYGAEAPFLRPARYSESTSPDIEFVVHALDKYKKSGTEFDAFSILRPTSPFRKPQTIQRAWSEFQATGPSVDSLRAVERCNEHPMKMWVIRGNLMHPLFAFGPQDLAASLGHLAQPRHPDVVQVMKTVIKKAHDTSIPVEISVDNDPELLCELVDMGI